MQKERQHFLIIRPGAIGDTLVVFPILQHLRTLSPRTHITFLGNAAVLPLLQAFRLADTVENYADLLWSQLFMLPTQRQQTKLYARLQYIDRAICWLTDTDGLVQQNLQAAGIPSITVAPGRPSISMPIVTYLAHSMGEDPKTISWLTPSAYRWQGEHIAAQPTRTIAIHPGSGGAQKCWPITYFATIITELWRQNIPVLLLAGPADHERISALHSLLPSPEAPTLLRLLQDVPLLAIAQELQHCQSYLGNDTGISHLAALLGVPTLVLFGPSDPLVWKPTGPTVVVLAASKLDELTPQAVYAQLIALSVQDPG